MEVSGKDDVFREQLLKELRYSYSPSSGPGGQHANKVSSRVILQFDVPNSQVLSKKQKESIFSKLGNRITDSGLLFLDSQEERSQIRNKQIVTRRFFDLISQAITPTKKRIPTKPSNSSKKIRLEEKRKNSDQKKLRKPPEV